MELTYKQRQFVAYYLGESGGNATDAARRAGYLEHQVTGHRLLRSAKIRAAIDAKLDQVAMSQDEILARLSDIASSSLGDFMEIVEDGYRLSIPKGKRRGKLHTLKKVKTKVTTTRRGGDVETFTETEIEVKDALPALVKLGEYRGLFRQRIDLTTNNKAIFEPIDDGRDPDLPPPGETA